jgi:tRNA dimethylallyltransferase
MSAPAADRRPSVVVVTGPTSAGKSRLALELARRFDGEIVNADSMQVYRFMDIGTNKPGPAERNRVPHHLLDVVPPDVRYSAGRYLEEARAAAADTQRRGKNVFLTGGTGLYIRAFLEGLIDAGEADLEFREGLEREHAAAAALGDPDRLHRRLREQDDEAARRIHPRDVRRIIRALELCRRRGGPASHTRRAHGFRDRPYRSLQLAIDPGREVLDARIEGCCRRMIERGLLQEVRGLRERGYGPELPSMQAIGYRHVHAVVEGADTLENALVAMQRDTRRFARRQRTWLRGVPETIWMKPDEESQILKSVEAFLCS